MGARADALEDQGLKALNRAKQMLLGAHWGETLEAIRAAEGAVVALREIERAAAQIRIGSPQALRHPGTQALGGREP